MDIEISVFLTLAEIEVIKTALLASGDPTATTASILDKLP